LAFLISPLILFTTTTRSFPAQVWFCLSTVHARVRLAIPFLEQIHRPSKDRRSLPFLMMNSVTNTMDNDSAAERMRVSLVRYHLAYVRTTYPNHPLLVRIIQARWTCEHDDKHHPEIHSPSCSFPFPKPFRLYLFLPSRPLRRCLPRFANLPRPAWCTSQPLPCSRFQAQLAPSPALIGFHPSRVRRLDGCLGGQPPSLRL